MSDSAGHPALPTMPTHSTVRHWPLPLLVAALAWLAIIATLDSSGAVPQLGEGPGLTFDETFNVQMGVYHVRAVREYGLGLLHIDSIREIFGAEVYNPDHPPLGRVLIGLAHELSWPLLHPNVPAGSVVVTCGRVASACGFALTILLIGWTTSRWYGRIAGLIAALSMVLMPRLFAHAHIASLETFTNLFYVATVLFVADRWTRGDRPNWGPVILSGVLLGLTLLTKIQGILLPIPIALWALWHWRLRAILPIILFGLTGVAVFFVSWPWLWLDPVAHLSEYLGRTTDRLTLYCWYMGQKWADTEVPWHYPVVMFAVTVPIGLHLLGMLGAIGDRGSAFGVRVSAEDSDTRHLKPDRRITQLITLNVLWPLAFFALPGITVYDGTRLFLMVFPLWAILIGRGGSLLWEWLAQRWSSRTATIALTLLLLCQSYGTLAMHPVQLSYYNLLVGGLRGADRLGFEVTYWGDSVTRSMLRDIGGGEETQSIFVAPVLHPFQLSELESQAADLKPRLMPFDDNQPWDVRRVLVIRRRADSWSALTPEPPNSQLNAEITREGVQLSGYYLIEPGTFGDQTP
ncbi:MAG: glycosyltransferase family 39 protein [Planctomycetaceae bacterium]|nr:glycosyltransferase family 39 protein [Planctomycetaceae bacterium]